MDTMLLYYCKNPKYSDTQKICYNHPKIWTRWLYQRVMHPKDAAGIANSVDPDPGSALFAQTYLSENLGSWCSRMIKPTKLHVRPVKTQISLGICPVWSEFSLCTQWVAKDPSFLHADYEDSDQTGQMPRLIWVIAGCTGHFLVLSWGSSNGVHGTPNASLHFDTNTE